MSTLQAAQEATDERLRALRLAGYLSRALIWSVVVIALYARTHTHREPWELLWVMAVVMVGSFSLDFIVRKFQYLTKEEV